MDLDEQAHRVRLMIRDRGSNFTSAFDSVPADAGIRTVLCKVRTSRMNAIAERWIGGCRRELLDRTLVWTRPTPAEPGMIPLTVPEIKRLLAAVLLRPRLPRHATHWLNWRRRHQARSRRFHQRVRLHGDYALVS